MWLQKVRGGVDAMAFSPDGRHLYTADSGGWVTEWDVAARTGRRLFSVERGSQWGMFCAAGGRFLVTRSYDPVVWDRLAGAEYVRPDLSEKDAIQRTGYCSMIASPGDDTRLLVAGEVGTKIRTWDTATRKFGPLFARWPNSGRIGWFDVSPDRATVAVLHRNPPRLILSDRATGVQTNRLDVPDDAFRVRFSPDGTTLAIRVGTRLDLWHPASGQVSRVEQAVVSPDRDGGPFWVFAFHPTLPVFAALNRDGTPTLFDRATHQPIRSLDFPLGKRVHCLTFSPDGLTCAVGGSNKQFVVFDVDG